MTAAGVTPQNPTATDSYTYGNADWGDLLTAYKGQAIAYDAVGNPLSYYNGSRYTFSWLGRRLTGATLGSTQMTFEYREDGLRTKKTVNGVTTEYFYDGSLLIAEQTGDVIVMYYYDENGAPIAMQYRDSTKASNAWDKYIFERNLQGDVVAIYSTSGTKLVSYTYDAWGNVSISYHNGGASTSATYNRLTYRGYYYDTDLELYYLQSRYYDAKVGRFINADDTEFLGANGDLNSYNLYAYCSNNPVMYQDPSGQFIGAGTILVTGAKVLATLGLLYIPIDMATNGPLIKTITEITTAVGDFFEEKKNANLYYVYALYDDNQTVQYVGRTKDIINREKAHKNDPNRSHLKLQQLHEGLTLEEARGLEQYYMKLYHTLNAESKANNQINGISPRNKRVSVYVEAAINYLGNRIHNEYLNFLEWW